MAWQPDLRRRPAPDLGAIGSEPALLEQIRAEVEATGPMTFARFMEIALYDAANGYYATGRPWAADGGDFLTAPETHPVLGRAIARQVDEVHARLGRPQPFVLREYGPGSGGLAIAILDAIAADGSPPAGRIRYDPIEADPGRTDAVRRRLTEAGHADALVAPAESGRPATAFVLANEVLDALPVHRLTVGDGRLREILVGWGNGGPVDVEGEPSSPALGARLAGEGIDLREGQRAEVCLALDGWMERAAASLSRGLLVVIDYGHPATELYDPARRGQGTLFAYARHRAHPDVLANVGRQDLTAHVDLTAVERAATAAGLEALGSTTQAEFLVGLGLETLLEAERDRPDATIESALALRAAAGRLLDPAATGAFRVLAFGRGIAPSPPLAGLSFRIDRQRAQTAGRAD